MIMDLLAYGRVENYRRDFDESASFHFNSKSVLACLREFAGFPLFRPAAERADHEFLDAST